MIQRYIGNPLIEDFHKVLLSTVQDYRLPIIEESFKTLAREVQNQTGGGLSLGTSRLEYQFSGWDLESCYSKACQFCASHDVRGLLDLEEQMERDDASSPHTRSTTREDQILTLLRGYHVNICAIPVDQMMTGFLDTLDSLRDIISKYASYQRSKGKDNWTSQDQREFTIAWVKHLVEFGIRKSTLMSYEESILTDPASHPELLEDLIQNACWVLKNPSEGLQEGGLQCRILDRVKSRDDSEALQKIGLSSAGGSGACPKCGMNLGNLPRSDGLSGSQTKYPNESKHILECKGKDMESVQHAIFTVQGEESLVDIACILNENVYVVLALNIENRVLCRKAGRAMPGLGYRKGDLIPLTVIDKIKDSQQILVPRGSEEGSEKENRRQKHPGRDESGRFQRANEDMSSAPSQLPERIRPDQCSSGEKPKKRRSRELRLSSSDKDHLAPQSGSPTGKKWFPDFISAMCWYFQQARKARGKRNHICSIEDAWKWRYMK